MILGQVSTPVRTGLDKSAGQESGFGAGPAAVLAVVLVAAELVLDHLEQVGMSLALAGRTNSLLTFQQMRSIK